MSEPELGFPEGIAITIYNNPLRCSEVSWASRTLQCEFCADRQHGLTCTPLLP
jgi:hypothetical protein